MTAIPSAEQVEALRGFLNNILDGGVWDHEMEEVLNETALLPARVARLEAVAEAAKGDLPACWETFTLKGDDGCCPTCKRRNLCAALAALLATP